MYFVSKYIYFKSLNALGLLLSSPLLIILLVKVDGAFFSYCFFFFFQVISEVWFLYFSFNLIIRVHLPLNADVIDYKTLFLIIVHVAEGHAAYWDELASWSLLPKAPCLFKVWLSSWDTLQPLLAASLLTHKTCYLCFFTQCWDTGKEKATHFPKSSVWLVTLLCVPWLLIRVPLSALNI